jgi:hypothetical protein
MWIFEEVNQVMIDFDGFEAPVGKRIHTMKPKFPSFTEAALEVQMKQLESEYQVSTAEQRAVLRQCLEEDAQNEELNTNFRMSIHKALKKLVLEYYPELAEISGAGIREIDSMLYTYMSLIRGNIMNILTDDDRASVPEQA